MIRDILYSLAFCLAFCLAFLVVCFRINSICKTRHWRKYAQIGDTCYYFHDYHGVLKCEVIDIKNVDNEGISITFVRLKSKVEYGTFIQWVNIKEVDV